MKRYLMAVCILLAALSSCSKDDEEMQPSSEQPGQSEVSFSYEQGIFLGVSLPYRKAAIGTAANGQSALVIYLHGGSNKGSDNTSQMNEAGIDSISNYLLAHGVKAVMLVPQCPADKSWGGQMNGVLKGLIDNYAKADSIDASHVYLFGGSMGGTGTWGMVSDYPGLLAAAMPVAGDPSRSNAQNVAQTPVYSVASKDDEVITFSNVEDFITKLGSLTNHFKFDAVTGWSHSDTCTKGYTAERLAWVFGH